MTDELKKEIEETLDAVNAAAERAKSTASKCIAELGREEMRLAVTMMDVKSAMDRAVFMAGHMNRQLNKA